MREIGRATPDYSEWMCYGTYAHAQLSGRGFVISKPKGQGLVLVSRASRIFPMCTHARMTSGRGESARKNTSGHSRQVFVSQPGMLG